MSATAITIAPISRLVLTGFMGSGKTTVGRELARQWGWRFVDLDDVVADREGLSVPALITERGEAAFRLAELAALTASLTHQGIVLALGGGTPETPAVHTLLQGSVDTRVIYLEAPFGALYERCLLQSADPAGERRPLFADPATTAERLHRRVPLYQRLAHLTVDAGSASPEQLANSICGLLKS